MIAGKVCDSPKGSCPMNLLIIFYHIDNPLKINIQMGASILNRTGFRIRGFIWRVFADQAIDNK